MRAAALGATGFIGSARVPALAKHADVVAVSPGGNSDATGRVAAVAADVSDATPLRAALDGVDVAYYLVHSLGSSDYAYRDRRAAGGGRRRASRTKRNERA